MMLTITDVFCCDPNPIAATEQRYARPDVDGASYSEGELSLLLLALQGPNPIQRAVTCGLRGRGEGGGGVENNMGD